MFICWSAALEAGEISVHAIGTHGRPGNGWAGKSSISGPFHMKYDILLHVDG